LVRPATGTLEIIEVLAIHGDSLPVLAVLIAAQE
jgi:hypothetical protein